ncbi:hypothetical protein BGZ93_001109 [Podila epicladia]|nr:hypothetical protein BGZ93_001109 [Podila epicladia]
MLFNFKRVSKNKSISAPMSPSHSPSSSIHGHGHEYVQIESQHEQKTTVQQALESLMDKSIGPGSFRHLK